MAKETKKRLQKKMWIRSRMVTSWKEANVKAAIDEIEKQKDEAREWGYEHDLRTNNSKALLELRARRREEKHYLTKTKELLDSVLLVNPPTKQKTA